MTAADPGDPVKGRYVTVALPRDALAAAMATAAARPSVKAERGPRLVGTNDFSVAQSAAGASAPKRSRPVCSPRTNRTRHQTMNASVVGGLITTGLCKHCHRR